MNQRKSYTSQVKCVQEDKAHAKWESLFYLLCVFFFFPPLLPSLGTARWQSSSSAVLFIHSSCLMGILLPSFKEAMRFTKWHLWQKKTSIWKADSKVGVLGGARGQQRMCIVCMWMYICELHRSKAVGERSCVVSACSSIPSLFHTVVVNYILCLCLKLPCLYYVIIHFSSIFY